MILGHRFSCWIGFIIQMPLGMIFERLLGTFRLSYYDRLDSDRIWLCVFVLSSVCIILMLIVFWMILQFRFGFIAFFSRDQDDGVECNHWQDSL